MRFKRLGSTSVFETEIPIYCKICGKTIKEEMFIHIHGYGFYCSKDTKIGLYRAFKNNEVVRARGIVLKGEHNVIY